ncbi:ANTAR domain-containing protein [uncultured Friedmanniella sp.]|uniref:ANTAR domain-containing protein n=1 Tax=uncultured Friedmanniella sp. TaxID=335381 RepID=UPI0035CC249A
MASDRGELAAARVAAAALRSSELRDRLARLRRGEPSTHEDVVLAKESAAHQKAEAARALDRLLQTYARAADLHRPGSTRAPGVARTTPGTRRTPPAVPRPAPSDHRDRQRSAAEEENQVLRRALVSLASHGDANAGWSKDRRQELWLAMADHCGQPSWQGWNDALCRAVPTVLPALRGVALNGYDGRGAPHLLGVTDEWTREREEVARLVGEGPGLEAYQRRCPVLVTEVEQEHSRWPGYVDGAVEAGVTTIGAFPVQLNGVGLGSITLYPRDQGGAGERRWADYFFLAAVAAKTLLADLDTIERGEPVGDAADDPVQLATGMLAAQLDLTVEEAFARLRAFAFSNARRLGEVAEAVVSGSLLIA